MENDLVLPLNNIRLINWATYLTMVIIGGLGAGSLTNQPKRLAFITLCFVFAVVYAAAIRSDRFTKWAHGYFAVQTLLFIGLIVLHSPSGAFTFLLFILAIHATAVFPGHIATRWVILFFLLASYSDFLINDLENAIGGTLFNFGVFFLVGMIGYNIRQTELSRLTNQQLLNALQTAQAQLHDLAIAKERNRLAREIHDGLGHYLTATTMQIQGARALLENTPAIPQPIAVLNALSKAETLLQEALADVRHSVAALRTAPTTSKPLSAAISDLVAECQAASGVETQLHVLGTPRPLNSQIELTLYRTVQEGLTNARKYAQAHLITVALTYEADKVRLNIGDDGQGSAVTSGGFGLLGLRERVQLVDGSIHLQTAIGQGFELSVEIPT